MPFSAVWSEWGDSVLLCVWHNIGSCCRPAGSKQVSAGALHLIVRISRYQKKTAENSKCHSLLFGPSGEIRTPGILNPNQAPYQLGHTRKYTSDVLSAAVPYSRFAALSICKQNSCSATATKQLGHTRILKIYYTPSKRKKQPKNDTLEICVFHTFII